LADRQLGYGPPTTTALRHMHSWGTKPS